MARSPPVAMDLPPYYKYVRPLPIVRNRATNVQAICKQMATMCMSSDGMHACTPELPLAGGIRPTWRAGLRRVLRWRE